MSLLWEGPLQTGQVAKQLEKMLFGPCASQITLEGLRSELLRVSLWELVMLRQPATLTASSVTTQQILGRARMFWEAMVDEGMLQSASWTQQSVSEDDQPWQDEEDENEGVNRYLLEALAEQGDVFSLGRGRWISVPLRLVPLSSSLYLLVGGMPTALLPQLILNDLRLHGSFRQIESQVIQSVPAPSQYEEWQFQTREHWLGAPALELPTLVEQFNQQELGIVQYRTAQSLEAYVASLDKPQGLRWRPLEHVSDGRYLLRSRMAWGQGRYSIGEIQSHCLIKQSGMPGSIEIRRLLYALGEAAGVPARARWEQETNTFVLDSELPMRERKLLATIGLLQPNKGHSYYPRRWRVASQQSMEVITLLKRLGIVVRSS